MKKRLCILLIAVMLLSLWVILPTNAASSVTVSGNDLASAIQNVSDGGTVVINGTCTVPASFKWPSVKKTVTITGGTLDLSSVGGNVYFNSGVIFDGVTLKMTANANVHCCGNKVVIKENVTVTNAVGNLFAGGGEGTTVASTDLTVLSGSYGAIYGGSYKGIVSGDTNLAVGGKTNSNCVWTDHNGKCFIYGGGIGDTVNGDTHLTFTGDAKANYIFGGGNSSPTIKGNIYATMSGGHTMSFYGGCYGSNKASGNNIYLTMTGGELEQLFGANQGASMTGNVDVRVLGGTVKRRIYGGCYNETSGTSFSTSYYVTGKIRLTIGGGANIDFSYSGNDKSIYAHSRHKTLSSSENTEIVFADETAYNTYKNKLKAQDFAMNIIMLSVSAADDIHYYTYTASGTTVTEKCAYHSDYSATATLAVDTSVSTKYNGGEIKAAKVTYSSGFEGDPFEITYEGNVNIGKATATIQRNGASASVEFNIEKGSRNAPSGLSASAETVLGKGDGKINGLTTEMQISRDGGSTFVNVTDTAMRLPSGDYYVRYGENANYSASEAVKLTVRAGNPLTVTFVADGKTVATKTVSYNGNLTDIPTVPAKTGYDQTAPKWDRSSFTGITTNLTVNAVYTVNKYTVTFVADGKTVSTVTVEHGKTVTNPPTVPAKSGYNGAWESKVSQGVTANVTVNAVYTEVSTQSTTTTTPPVTSTTPEDTTTPESSETQTESTESATVTDPVETSPDVTESETESDGMTSPVTTDGENDPSGEKQPYDVTAIVIVSSLAVVTAIAVTVIIVSKRKK